MILYHPYAESLEKHPRLADTWMAFELFTPFFKQAGWRIIHHACQTDTSYERMVRSLWGVDDLIIWEQDLVPTVEILQSLAQPHAPICAQAYRLHAAPDAQAKYASLARAVAVATPEQRNIPGMQRMMHDLALWQHEPNPYAHRNIDDTTGAESWIAPGALWADIFSLGLTRFTKEVMVNHSPNWRPGSWRDLDTRIAEWMWGLGIPAHVHWPEIPHHHHCACHREQGSKPMTSPVSS